MIDAEFRSEERFARLALAYEEDCEKERVCKAVDEIIAKHKMQPEIHTTKVANGKKEVLVIEYHDDSYREAGDIFEEIMKSLDIKSCS